MITLTNRVKWLIGVVYVASSLVWGPTAEAAFHLEYVENDRPVTATISGLDDDDAWSPASKQVVTPTLYTAPPKPKPVVKVAGVSQTRSVWDRLAQCESGGDWSYNGSSGYDGGIQFSPSTWQSAGGTKYAAYAHQATREQQIAVAESWLAETSWAQWPSCSRQLGLR